MKIAFFDIDGTLIDLDNNLLKPTKNTVDSLKLFQQQGNYIVAASARGSLPDCLDEINFDGIILSDGQYIEFDGEVIIDNIFSLSDIDFLLPLFLEFSSGFVFGGNHGKWISSHNSFEVKELERRFGDVDNFYNTALFHDKHLVKANSCTPLFKNLLSLDKCYQSLPSNWSVNKYTSGLLRMDIHLPGFNKGTACEYLVNYLKIDPFNAFSFGDGENDIEMMKLIHHSVAMGNANQNIKNHAQYTTLSVGDDGVAHFIRKIIKGESY